jgi:hypothetical protein
MNKKKYEKLLNNYWNDKNWKWNGEHNERFCTYCGRSELNGHEDYCKLYGPSKVIERYENG